MVRYDISLFQLINEKNAAPPVANTTIGETIAEEELVAGNEGVVLVPFHSNPAPTNITWYLSDLEEPLGFNETIGQYTNEGWMKYVRLIQV